MNLNKIKRFWAWFVLLSFIIMIPAVLIANFLDYASVTTVSGYELDNDEYRDICSEYYLDPETAGIDYIFSAGRDYQGIRLLIKESDLENLNILFEEPILSKGESDYFNIDKQQRTFKPYLSDGIKREATSVNLSEPTDNTHIYDIYGCCIFTDDDKYYMEMTISGTHNAGIYTKNYSKTGKHMKKLINIYTGIFLLCVFLNILTVLIVGMTKICKADGNLLDKEKS